MVNVGDWVLYTLSSFDVETIRRQRAEIPPNYNPVTEDMVLPALVVAVSGGKANLKVFCDGSDSYWIPQREVSREPLAGYFSKPSPWVPLDG